MKKGYYTVNELVELFRFDRNFIINRRDKLIPLIISPNRYLYSKTEVESLLKNRKPYILRSKEQINYELQDTNRNLEMVGSYKGLNRKTKFYCLVKGCGCIWNASPGHIVGVEKNGCPRCGGSEKLTDDIVNTRLLEKNIKLLDLNYRNSSYRHNLECKVCQYKWRTRLREVFKKSKPTGCPNCSNIRIHNSSKLTNNEILKKLKNRNIKIIGKYINNETLADFQCLKSNCRGKWYAKPNNIFSGTGCPDCSRGKGEKHCAELIKKHLKWDVFKPKLRLNFNGRMYRPDFYHYAQNNHLTIIEYNGIQHYTPVDFSGRATEEEKLQIFKKQQQRDNELRMYCKENGITLLEVHYTWDDIRIIDEFKLLKKDNIT